ncbi:hypothetical protein Franean1_6506 [Parafrankia sp. EAN1pec]|nr:hypothetical protein Franean1_6506 [Frankia sp. EAN1pec]
MRGTCEPWRRRRHGAAVPRCQRQWTTRGQRQSTTQVGTGTGGSRRSRTGSWPWPPPGRGRGERADPDAPAGRVPAVDVEPAGRVPELPAATVSSPAPEPGGAVPCCLVPEPEPGGLGVPEAVPPVGVVVGAGEVHGVPEPPSPAWQDCAAAVDSGLPPF